MRGLPISALRKQRIVVVGAGSAGMGVVRMIAQGACNLSPYICVSRVVLFCRGCHDFQAVYLALCWLEPLS